MVGVVIGADGNGFTLGQITDPGGRDVTASCHHLYHDVAVGNDGLEPVVVAADRQGADIEVGQAARGVGDGVRRLRAFGTAAHDLLCGGHHGLPFLVLRYRLPATRSWVGLGGAFGIGDFPFTAFA
ncbi:MAG TPA: hypothetical protein VFU35_02865 [Jatrophihabitans sp.]|nr:hypothetical protein [Jatrophihabitans sp.]